MTSELKLSCFDFYIGFYPYNECQGGENTWLKMILKIPTLRLCG